MTPAAPDACPMVREWSTLGAARSFAPLPTSARPMRLTFALLGLELDLTLGLATAAAEDDPAAALNGGTLGRTPITFAPSPPTPMEWQPPERTIPWEPEDE